MITENSSKAALYIRCACVGQGDPCGEQRKLLTQEAASHGKEVTREYVDAGCPGTSPKKCPQLLRLLDDAKAGLFKHLFVRDVARLSRGSEVWKLISELQDAGVTMHFVDDKMVV